jgi:hypothetical protein
VVPLRLAILAKPSESKETDQMPNYVRVRGLARRGIRLRSAIAAQNAVTVSGTNIVIVDLDDPKTRADIAHHAAIGQLQVVDAVARAALGVAANAVVVDQGITVLPNPGSLQLTVTPGTFRWNSAGTWTTVQFAGATLTLGAANATNPRIDYVQVTNAGVASIIAGTAAAVPVAAAAPTAPTFKVAEVYLPANATQPLSVLDTRPLP